MTYEKRLYPEEALAESMGLRLEHYNSGVSRCKISGWKVFAAQGKRDYFAPGHLFHARRLDTVATWLAGYAAARLTPFGNREFES